MTLNQYANISALGASGDVGGAVNPAHILSKRESRLALQYVVNAIREDVSIDALERAVATVKAYLEAPAQHASDCAVHNEPAYPAGPCNCGAEASA